MTSFYLGLIKQLNDDGPGVPNHDPVTGFPYGVFQGNNAMDLLNEIQTQGYDLSIHEAEANVRQAIKDFLEDVDPEESLFDALKVALRAIDQIGNVHNDRLLSWVAEHGDRDQHAFDIDGLTDDVLDYMHEHWDTDEMGPMLYAEDDVVYRQSWLGGAPLVWVIRSRFLAAAQGCSPCVPGARDLDSPEAWYFDHHNDETWYFDGLDAPLGLCPPPSQIYDSYAPAEGQRLWAKRVLEIDPASGKPVAFYFPPTCEPKEHPNCYEEGEIIGLSLPAYQPGASLIRWDGDSEDLTNTDLYSLTKVTLDEAVRLYLQADDAGKEYLAKLEPLLHRLDIPRRRIALQ